jgi:hypothetical protein
MFLRQNRHVERDPNITIKLKDGGDSFLDEINIEKEEEKSPEVKSDIVLFLMKQFNQSK